MGVSFSKQEKASCYDEQGLGLSGINIDCNATWQDHGLVKMVPDGNVIFVEKNFPNHLEAIFAHHR